MLYKDLLTTIENLFKQKKEATNNISIERKKIKEIDKKLKLLSEKKSKADKIPWGSIPYDNRLI